MRLRASQINGCNVCVDMGWRELRKAGETDERLFAVAAWRDTPWFTDAERAPLALAEAVTRLSDRADAVPDEIWDERHRPEETLLYQVVQAEIETFLACRRSRSLPRFVEREMRGFLECGILAYGFLRVPLRRLWSRPDRSVSP